MKSAATPRRDPAPPAFPPGAPTRVSRTRTSALCVARFRPEMQAGDMIAATMGAEEAHVALFQLRPHPAHDFLFEGRVQRTEAAPRGSLHMVDLRGEPVGYLRAPVDTLMFHMPRAVLDEVSEDADAPRIDTLKVPEPWRTCDPVLDQLHGLLIDGVAAGGTSDTLLYDHLMLGIAGHFATAYGGLTPRSLLKRGGLTPWQERRAKELLAENLAREMSLADIALECGLSSTYFGRAFKVSTGLTPHGWRQVRRIERAKDLLLGSSAPLADIAAACGFADQSHFNRVFAQHVGMTPGAWRRFRREG